MSTSLHLSGETNSAGKSSPFERIPYLNPFGYFSYSHTTTGSDSILNQETVLVVI